MKLCRVVILLMLAGCAVAVTGCAEASQAASSEPTRQFPEARYLGAITETIKYDDAGITLTPPRAGDVPNVDWHKAYAHCGVDAMCDNKVAPTINYGRATVRGYGDIQKDGSIVLIVEDRLVYVLTYAQSDGEQCPRSGPMQLNSEQPDTPSIVPCTLISYLDAGSGEPLGASSWSSEPGQ